MLITPEILEALEKAQAAHGSHASLAKRLGVVTATIDYWLNGWSKSINDAVWRNQILPVLAQYIPKERKEKALSPTPASIKSLPSDPPVPAAVQPDAPDKRPRALGDSTVSENGLSANPNRKPQAENADGPALLEERQDSTGGSSVAKRKCKKKKPHFTPLTEAQILSWADEHRAKTGKWPAANSTPVHGTTWVAIGNALVYGHRGLPGGMSLPRFLSMHRDVKLWGPSTLLSEDLILGWADAHREAIGKWPVVKSGSVLAAPGEMWGRIDAALTKGLRGLPGGSSLAKLLSKRRGAKYVKDLPKLRMRVILRMADEHHARTGRWPMASSGLVGDTNWRVIDSALTGGGRGLPGGSSLAKLLAKRRGVRNIADLPALTEKKILAWADAHHERTGKWPSQGSGPVKDASSEKWMNISVALKEGTRGLSGGSSLAKLLNARRADKGRAVPSSLTEERILALADLHHERTGRWPSNGSGSIEGTSWAAIEQALIKGRKGLPGASSIAKLLAKRRGKRNMGELPPLDIERMLEWADEHRARTGRWPAVKSGPVYTSPEETWARINDALTNGYRGLPAGSSLAKLLVERRSSWSPTHPPPLTEERVRTWAREHRERTGEWPSARSGPVKDAPGESWRNIAVALAKGRRGLPGGSSLAKLLSRRKAIANADRIPNANSSPIECSATNPLTRGK